MHLAEADYDNSETGCCAKLDVAKWDRKTWQWDGKPFLRDHIRAFLHVPLNFGSVISRDHEVVERAGAYPADPIWLTEEVSPWGSEVYVAIDRDELPGEAVEKLSGTYVTRVFEGAYKDARHWAHDMEAYVKREGLTLDALYFFYATCPKCAKHYGANRVVLFAKVHSGAARSTKVPGS